jgi:serralysin
MARYSFNGISLNAPSNYALLNADGTPVLDSMGEPVHPSSVPGGADIIENGSANMTGTISVGSFLSWPSGNFQNLLSGTIEATTISHTSAGGGSDAAHLDANTFTDGVGARANGTVQADTISGGAFASDGGIITVSTAIVGLASASSGGIINTATVDSAIASGANSQINAATIVALSGIGDQVWASNGAHITVGTVSSSGTAIASIRAIDAASVTVTQLAATAQVTATGGSTVQINLITVPRVSVTVSNADSSFNSGSALSFTEGGGLTADQGADVSYASLTASTFSSGLVTRIVANDATMRLGTTVIGQTGRASLDIRNGSELIAPSLLVGDVETGNGAFLVTGSGSTATISGNVTLGDRGDAGQTAVAGGNWPFATGVAQGGQLDIGGDLRMGIQSTSSATMILENTGSFMQVHGATVIGDAGDASLTVLYGSSAQFDGSVTIGQQVTSDSSFAVRAQAFLSANAHLFLPASATIGGDLTVGVAGRGSGGVSATSSLTIDGDLIVGGINGSFSSSGTTIVHGDISLAPTSGSVGRITIGGGTFAFDGGFDVGVLGAGQVSINGGIVGPGSGPGDIRVGIGGNGTLTIAATGSLEADEIRIADGHAGTLEVLNGGELDADTVNVGINGAGSVVVSGAGAELRADEVMLGHATATLNDYLNWEYTGIASALFTVQNQGYVSIADRLTLRDKSDTFDSDDLVVSRDSSFEIGGDNGYRAGFFTIDSGGVLEGHGGISFSELTPSAKTLGTLENNGLIEAKDGELSIEANVTGSGITRITDNATLVLRGGFSGTVEFAGEYETILEIRDPLNFTGTITGLDAGDTIRFTWSDFFAAYQQTVAHTEIAGGDLVITLGDGSDIHFDLGSVAANTAFTQRYVDDDHITLTLEHLNGAMRTHLSGTPTGNPYVDSLIDGWAAWPPGTTLSYWFADAGDVRAAVDQHGETKYLHLEDENGAALKGWTGAEMDAFREALTLYESISSLRFVSAASVESANLVWWLNSQIAADNAAGASETPSLMPDGHLWQYFNYTGPGWPFLEVGGFGRSTIIHELGHALGLLHPHDGGSEFDTSVFPGVVPDHFSNGLPDHWTTGNFGQNQTVFSTMSYNTGWNGAPSNSNQFGSQGGLGAFDVAAIQQLYGANATTKSGDDVYLLPTANGVSTGWQAIWDTGGTDTISAENSTTAVTIQLLYAPLEGPNAGGLVSWQHGISGGYTIAYNVLIENAIGGAGDDILNGDPLDNRFVGGLGDDRIDGGDGIDTAVFGVERNSAAIINNANGSITVRSAEGDDTLFSIEILEFLDGVVEEEAPEVSVTGIGIDILDGDPTPGTADGTAFGLHAVKAAVTRTFTVTNQGDEELSATGLKLPKGFKFGTDKLLSRLQPGQSDTFTVSLDTAKVGVYTGFITFNTNDSDENPFSFAVSGEVAAPEINVSGNNANILDNDKTPGAADHTDFGSVAFGDAPVIRSFTIHNTGGAPLAISGVTVPLGFTLIAGFPATVAAQSTATIQVQLDSNATGARKGDIVITSNDSNEATFNFTVQGDVTPQNRTGDATENTFIALSHAEAFSGLDGLDTVSYLNSTGLVVASLVEASAKKNAGFAAGDLYVSIENLIGSDYADTLTGNTGNNVLEGRDGADKLDGGTGIDTASYASAGSGVTADLLKATNNQGAAAAGDTYKNIENLLGSGFGDTLVGNTLANAIDGGDSDDSLTGNGGIDTLTGGLGGDTFRFNASKDGGGTTGDVITDFVSGEDHIGVLRSGFKILDGVDLGAGGVLDFAAEYFVSGLGDVPVSVTNPSGVAATKSGHGQFLFNETSNQLWWDEDGSGAKKALLLATFGNGAHVTSADFDLF